MAQPMSFFVPHPMATVSPVAPAPFASTQEPKSAPDTPMAPTGGTNIQLPGGPQGGGGGGPSGPAQPAGPCGMGDPSMMLFMGLAIALMYFLVMRPESKRRKEQQQMLAAIKVGDHVVTLGGMHGVVAGLTEKTVTLRIDTTKMTFDRSAIARIERDDTAAPEAKKA